MFAGNDRLMAIGALRRTVTRSDMPLPAAVAMHSSLRLSNDQVARTWRGAGRDGGGATGPAASCGASSGFGWLQPAISNSRSAAPAPARAAAGDLDPRFVRLNIHCMDVMVEHRWRPLASGLRQRMTISTRRFCGSRTPGPVGTSKCVSPKPWMVMAFFGTPSLTSSACTAWARRTDRPWLY